jgi:hypothetical protein
MMFQTGMDGGAGDLGFRSFRNSTTNTSTVTIAAGTPLILETATASANGGWANIALTSTSVINNLYIGNSNAATPPDTVGLCQCYGVDTDALVATAGAAVGVPLIPNVATFITAAVSTGTAQVFTPGVLGGGVVTVLIAPTGAAQVASTVFVRAV